MDKNIYAIFVPIHELLEEISENVKSKAVTFSTSSLCSSKFRGWSYKASNSGPVQDNYSV
jgi:hypothetical protein